MPAIRDGENDGLYWRRVPAERGAFLIDVDAYFRAFAAAAEQARHSIVIAGWDFNGQVALWREPRGGEVPAEIGPFLRYLVERHEDLHVYVLEWDFSALYALDREILPRYRWDWRDHERIHFELDGCHPIGCSHHQKIVVVDDAIAFSGGIDFGPGRWDTSRHLPQDVRRIDWRGETYEPFHDVQMAVSGAAARALGDLVRERWQRAAESELPRVDASVEVWPRALAPDIVDTPVAIARTKAAYEGSDEVREVERSMLDAVRRARDLIYFENQYFTAKSVGDAIEERLAEKDGPEIVVVVRKACSGWLEQSVMATLRTLLVTRLRAADRFGRFRIYYPCSGRAAVHVHAKVMIVDDRIARVGSANLNNRSMGLDSECDLIVEAGERDDLRRAIARFRDRLLAHHLDVTAEEVGAAVAREGSVAAVVEALRGGDRSLRELEIEDDVESWSEGLLSATRLADPERPLDADVVAATLGADLNPRSYRGALAAAAAILLGVVLLAAWHWSVFGSTLSAGMR